MRCHKKNSETSDFVTHHGIEVASLAETLSKETHKEGNREKYLETGSTKKQDHPRMNVALDQTIFLGLQIFFNHRSLRSIYQKILMTPPPTPFFDLRRSLEIVWMSSVSYSSSLVLLSFCLSVLVFLSCCHSVSISMLYLSKVPIDGVHVTDICYIS